MELTDITYIVAYKYVYMNLIRSLLLWLIADIKIQKVEHWTQKLVKGPVMSQFEFSSYLTLFSQEAF
jgi:hypothetical protein